MIGAALMIIAGIMLAIGIVLDLFAVAMAPLGYQDETGFHIGTPKAEAEEGWAWANPS
jgi:hypothetical protein